MESEHIILLLKNSIEQFKQISQTSSNQTSNALEDIEQKESSLFSKIVEYFNKILSDNLKVDSINHKNISNNYWTFISNHMNSLLVRFCNVEENENYSKKGEKWIILSILDKTFSDSIKEIYNQGFDEKKYEKTSIIREYKSEIINILEELDKLSFVHIKNKDYEKYLKYLKGNSINIKKEVSLYNNNVLESPIPEITNNETEIIFSELENMPLINTKINIHEPPSPLSNNSVKIKEFIVKKHEELWAKTINNFYVFNNNLDINNHIQIFNNNQISINNNNLLSEAKINPINNRYNDILNSNEESEEEIHHSKNCLILNPTIHRFLPTDKFYEIIEKSSENQYNKDDIIIYKKKKRIMSNCLLLYLNKFYQKTPYHKFYKNNIFNKPITLQKQNYQCYICFKRFLLFLNIPIEPIYWCSYYMRFVCKNCIEKEYSIIPHFILENWCFEKFSISKKAKKTLLNWYNKPIIVFKKKNKLISKFPQLNNIIKIKRKINDIVDYMKCENKFKIIENIFGEYEYIALKEYIFSIRDLVEVNNNLFDGKINEFKDKLIEHISNKCIKCKYEGEICAKCGFDEKIFFYDFNVFHCHTCGKNYHKKCIELDVHIH